MLTIQMWKNSVFTKRHKFNLCTIKIILFILAIIYFFLWIIKPITVLDEGRILTGTSRVLNGDLPLRDFFAPYLPLANDIQCNVQFISHSPSSIYSSRSPVLHSRLLQILSMV